MSKLHDLLGKQLKSSGINQITSNKKMMRLIEQVNRTYIEAEQLRIQMGSALETTTQQLQDVRSELEVVFSAFPDLFLRIDQHLCLLDYKVGLDHHNHPSFDKMLGQPLEAMPVIEIRESLQAAVKKVQHSGEMVSTQFQTDWKKQIGYFEARLYPAPDNQIFCIIRKITVEKSVELALIKSEQQYRTVLESSPDPIIVYDMEGNTQYLNPAFTKVFGWTLAELESGPVDFVPPQAHQTTQEKIQQLRAGEDIQGFETQRLNRNGEVLDVIINASLRIDNDNRAIGSVVTIVDISPLKKLEAELRYTKEQAESANQAKSEFLANMSHELRTPMHAILGFAKIIIEKIDRLQPPKILEYVEEVFSAGQRLMLLLNDLLDLSKLEVGRVDYDMQIQPLSDIVSLVIHEFSSVSAEKEIEIEFDKPVLDDAARLDQNKMIQVVRNLLSNAIKFSYPKNRIIVTISRQSGILMLAFKDFGIGIPPEELDSVFDKFVQSSKSKSEAGGTGLGLSICNEIIEAHEGRIWAKNNPEGGTTFFVTLSSA